MKTAEAGIQGRLREMRVNMENLPLGSDDNQPS